MLLTLMDDLSDAFYYVSQGVPVEQLTRSMTYLTDIVNECNDLEIIVEIADEAEKEKALSRNPELGEDTSSN